MRDYVLEHIQRHLSDRVRPAIKCADGMRYSVQASDTHYCSPREKIPVVDLIDGYIWHEYEVWAYSTKMERYVTKEPLGWVPKDKINKWIHKHGGFSDEH